MLRDWSWKRINWSLRKVKLPLGPRDLVLEVGSGGNPHPAADVLLDRYLSSAHHGDYALVVDRPAVLGDACKMPFKDKTFDFIIASHVLEHVNNPDAFLSELQRVAKAGYIETPNAIFERLVPYGMHLLEIVNIKDTLFIHKKYSARPDPFLNDIDLVKQSSQWNRFFYGNPELFHVCYFWKDKINWKVVNPEVSCDWFEEPEEEAVAPSVTPPATLRSRGLSLLRRWYKLRDRALNLMDLLVCPDCHGSLSNNSDLLRCNNCGTSYRTDPIPNFNQPVV